MQGPQEQRHINERWHGRSPIRPIAAQLTLGDLFHGYLSREKRDYCSFLMDICSRRMGAWLPDTVEDLRLIGSAGDMAISQCTVGT